MREPRIGAAQLLGKPRRLRREALDVQFVDDGAAPRHVRVRRIGIVLRHVAVVDRDRDRNLAERVERVHRAPRRTFDQTVLQRAVVGEDGRVERHRPFDAFGVGVEQELVRVEAQSVAWIPCAVGAVAVVHAVPRRVQMQIPQSVVRTFHAEQRLAHAERFEHARADREAAYLFDERQRRLLVDAHGLVVEAARLVDRLEDAEPQLVGGFGTRDDVSAAVVGEEQAWTRRVTMKFGQLHDIIVGGQIRRAPPDAGEWTPRLPRAQRSSDSARRWSRTIA